MRSFAKYCKATLIAGAALFFGVKSAYYSAIRALLSLDATCEQDVVDLVDSGEFPDQLLLELYTNMSEPGILDKWAGSDPGRLHFKCLLTESMQDSSFYVEGTETLACPRKGVKPGDALADLLFSLLLAPILERIAQDLDAAGLLLRPVVSAPVFSDPDSDPSVPISDATFADDTAFLIRLPMLSDQRSSV